MCGAFGGGGDVGGTGDKVTLMFFGCVGSGGMKWIR